jgi:predicted metal-dependent hydrolase
MPEAQPATPLRARTIRFDWSKTPLQWIPGAPVASHVINVLHLIAPVGERRFIEAMRDSLPHLHDDRLKAEVVGFIGQEATHARAHAEVLDHMRACGLDPSEFLGVYERIYDHVAGSRPPVPMPDGWWLYWRVAFTAAAEQITCVAGHWILDAEALDKAGADPVMLSFLRWHGAEEVEHRAVAFDVLKHLTGPGEYPWRAAAMLTLLPVLIGLWHQGAHELLARDPALAGQHFSYADFAAAMAAGQLPGLAGIEATLRYFDPAFHPGQTPMSEGARAFIARMAAGAVPA